MNVLHCTLFSFVREWSLRVGEQHYGSVWARSHFNTNYQTQEGARSRGGVNPTDHCWHFSQPGLDCSSNWQVKPHVVPLLSKIFIFIFPCVLFVIFFIHLHWKHVISALYIYISEWHFCVATFPLSVQHCFILLNCCFLLPCQICDSVLSVLRRLCLSSSF